MALIGIIVAIPFSQAASNTSSISSVDVIPDIAQYCELVNAQNMRQSLDSLDTEAKIKFELIHSQVKKLADFGEPQAQYLLAKYLFAENESKRSSENIEQGNASFYERLRLVNSSATAGFPLAQHEAYIYNVVATDDEEQAQKRYLEVAANNGIYDAVLSLLNSCNAKEDGSPIRKNDENCIKWQVVFRKIRLISIIPHGNNNNFMLNSDRDFMRPYGVTKEIITQWIKQGIELAKQVQENRDTALNKFPLLKVCSYMHK